MKYKIRAYLIPITGMLIGILILFLILKKADNVSLTFLPEGKNFAFTISDDPDGNTLEKVQPVFDYLRKTGIKATAAVWIFNPSRTNGIPDLDLIEHPKAKTSWQRDSCERPEYLSFMQGLQSEGFEIALHGASTGNDFRNVTVKAYEKFYDNFGNYPNINVMHAENLENIYWGKKIVNNKILREIIGILTKKANFPFAGEIPSSEYFCGDIIKSKTKYVRLFGTSKINTLKFNPSMPYFDPEKPFVNYWFSFSDGSTPKRFSKLLSKKNIRNLAKSRGACVVYTHFAHGFYKNGKLDPRFKTSIDDLLSEPDGWFATCSVLLDRLLSMKKVFLTQTKKALLVYNLNDYPIEGITLLANPHDVYFDFYGNTYQADEEGEIIIQVLKGHQCIVLSQDNNYLKKYSNQNSSQLNYVEFKNSFYFHNPGKTNNFLLDFKTIGKRKIYDLHGNKIEIENTYQSLPGDFSASLPFLFFKDDFPTSNTNGVGIIEELNLILNRAWLYFKHNY